MTDRLNSINFPEPYPDYSCLIKELEQRMAFLEKTIREMASKQPVIIERVYIKRINVGKLHLKMDDINIKKLSGELNIDISADENAAKKESVE